VFHYSAYHLESIADNARDVDLAIRWGFGWQLGPFETWQAAGWDEVARAIEETSPPARRLRTCRCQHGCAARRCPTRAACIAKEGAYAPARDAFAPRRKLTVYRPPAVSGSGARRATADRGTTMFETDSCALGTSRTIVAIVSFKTKANTISEGVLDGICRRSISPRSNAQGS
jgi:3-hydroxyacyl-CoA dehydrogenase